MNYKKIPILHRMTTTFFFDLFGVLLGADKSTLLNFIAKRTDNSFETVEKVFINNFTEFEQSRISFSGFFQKIQYGLENGDKLTIDEFKSTWMNQDLAELPTVNFLKTLSENYSVNLISNVSNSYLNHLKSKFEFFTYFDHTITSEQAGSRKPSEGIFLYSLELTNATPQSAIFIDDQSTNVRAAVKIGITGHHYTNFQNFKTFIEDYV